MIAEWSMESHWLRGCPCGEHWNMRQDCSNGVECFLIPSSAQAFLPMGGVFFMWKPQQNAQEDAPFLGVHKLTQHQCFHIAHPSQSQCAWVSFDRFFWPPQYQLLMCNMCVPSSFSGSLSLTSTPFGSDTYFFKKQLRMNFDFCFHLPQEDLLKTCQVFLWAQMVQNTNSTNWFVGHVVHKQPMARKMERFGAASKIFKGLEHVGSADRASTLCLFMR